MATTTKTSSKKPKKAAPKSKSSNKKTTTAVRIHRPKIALLKFKKYILYFLSALIVALVGIFWYYKIYTDPQKIFWGMVDNNLSTGGYSKETSQESGSFVSHEINQVVFNPEIGVISTRDITDGTQQPPTRIKLEALGTRGADYQHYILIDRPAADGKSKPDYGKVYGMWLKSDESSAQLINSNLFGPILFGNLPEPVKNKVMSDLKKAYKVDYKSVKKLNMDGRRTYSFDTEVALSHYASAAQKYARALGLAVADQIDPTSYSPEAKTRVTVYIDALSRQIRKVEYQSGNSLESYTAHGLGKSITPPAKTVTPEEFQNAINAVSQE